MFGASVLELCDLSSICQACVCHDGEKLQRAAPEIRPRKHIMSFHTALLQGLSDSDLATLRDIGFMAAWEHRPRGGGQGVGVGGLHNSV